MAINVSKPIIDIRSELDDLKKPSGVAGEAVLKAETPEEQQNIIGVNKKNWIINGDFQIWERGTTGSATNVFTQESADRWWSVRGSLNQETDTYGNPYAHIVCGNYADSNYILTKIENPKRFAGKWLTLQFEMKSDEGMKDGFVYVRNYSASNSWQVHKNISFKYGSYWKKFVHTWYMPESNTYNAGAYGLEIFIYGNDGASGFNHNTKSFDIKNVQLVEGHYPEGIEFIGRSYGEELALCQRYFYAFQKPVLSAQSTNDANSFIATSYNANSVYGVIDFPSTMRTFPSISSGGTWYTRASNNISFTASFGVQRVGNNSAVVAQSTGTQSANDALWVEPGNGAFLYFSAEL